MVHGIDVFTQHFNHYSNHYVLIGGSACDILMDELGLTFRATKDLDIVLIIEAINEDFYLHFLRFITLGGYIRKEVGGLKHQFYRFSHPTNHAYPKQIELFCRRLENVTLSLHQICTKIPLNDEITSLSAILLNDDYYELLMKRKREIRNVSIIDIETLIVFKIRAWLDNKEKKERGEKVTSNDVNKHKNDVLRLLVNVSSSSRVKVNVTIRQEIINFCELIKNEAIDLRNLELNNVTLDELLNVLESVYLDE
ncbi:MAG: hypothetical protein KGZ84_06870 [Erysipelotrichia bacterium]|jgi:hypothetical protein|nr:hypothetical protein [Erysipelotrichia bacterium]